MAPMTTPVSVNRPASQPTPTAMQNQIARLREHLAILEHVGADPKIIALVRSTLTACEDALRRQFEHA